MKNSANVGNTHTCALLAAAVVVVAVPLASAAALAPFVAVLVVVVVVRGICGLFAATLRARRYWSRFGAPRRNPRRGSDLSANPWFQAQVELSPSLVK